MSDDDSGPERFQISTYFRRESRQAAWYQYVAFGAATLAFFLATVIVNTLVIAGPLTAEEMSIYMSGTIVMLAASAVCFNGAFDEWMRWKPDPEDDVLGEDIEMEEAEANTIDEAVEQNVVSVSDEDEEDD